MPGPEDNTKYPERPKLTSEQVNKTAPKKRRDHYGEWDAPAMPPLEKSQMLEWMETGKPEDPSRYVMMPPREVPFKKLPLATKFISANTRHLKEIGAFRTMMPELFGEAGYKAVDDAYASFASGEFRTAQARGMFKNAPNCSLQEIAAFICTVYDIQNFPIVIAEADYDKEIVRVQLYKGLPKYCPYDVRQGDYRLCAATASYERDLVKMCNPKYRAYLSRTKAIGDDCCELTIDIDPTAK
ncbi:hypothetical protein ACFLVE_00360 [Chloroflexota bacterium]